MRIVKVLFLDDAPWSLPDLTQHGIKLEIIQEAKFGTLEVYNYSERIIDAIKRITTEKLVDIILVGNNLGIGVKKAMAIANDMREKTVVVWNFYAKGDEIPYASLGFKIFGSRIDLPKLIPSILDIS